ncbi:uncharacterized protein LOC132644191 [Lycium barbarum]|uniref:uncharacterized protein LOC132644191 n=1 Tax=Lycium barbarum TaxID=112863 RepID=UPI00293E486E|nr:uncharacterized protein LOC132644191 [Lycium barbarum]
MDVYNAFLQGDLNDEIYMELPQGFQSQEDNDMLITGDSLDAIVETKAELQKAFKMKDLGAAKPFHTPIETSIKLTTREYDQHLKEIIAQQDKQTGKKTTCVEDEVLQDQGAYQRLLGKLLYLTVTRPDISYSEVYNWFFIKLGDSLVSWKSKKQSTISRSLAEAEYRSLANTVSELTWLTGLNRDLGVQLKLLVCVYSDSKAAIQIAANPMFHERTKHIEIDCHFIREKIQQGLIKTEYLPTIEQLADVLTKGLNKIQQEYLLSKLGLLNVFNPS